MKTWMIALAAGALTAVTGTAQAALLTTSVQEVKFTSQGSSLVSQFDQSLGVLKSVNIAYVLTGGMSGHVSNQTDFARTMSRTFIMTSQIGGLMGPTQRLEVSASCVTSNVIQSFSIATVSCRANSSGSTAVVDDTLLAAFVGTGTKALTYNVAYTSPNGNIRQPSSDLTLKLSYSYAAAAAPAVPEPATWAMMAGGFALVGAAARRRRRSTVATFA